MSTTNTSTDLTKRQFIKIASASLAMLSFPMANAFTGSVIKTGKKNPKIIWVLLRGALDSLHTVIPTSDTNYKKLRPKLSNSFKTPLLTLNENFALHPSLKNLHEWYKDNSMSPFIAVSSGYAKRSHFDGQDYLESGKGNIDHDSGWLARAIDIKNKKALAVSRSTPISLRSSEQVNTWFPSNLKNANEDIYTALANLYQFDEPLKENLSSGLEVKALIGMKDSNNKKMNKKVGQFSELTKACASLITEKNGVDCAMLELGGWDTHFNQGARLTKKLSELDDGLAELKKGLGDTWDNTVVIVGTEFGRTAKENGTGGTDHGTGSALILAGGAVNGGKVKGDWPGLANEQLFEQRDLMPTSNSFGWIGNVLSQHWQFSEQELAQVFPQIKPYNDTLIRR